jgi:hypothetical protein
MARPVTSPEPEVEAELHKEERHGGELEAGQI